MTSQPLDPPRAALLVVDDDEMVRQSIAILLELDGHHVLTAGDGVEALEVFKRHMPALVLTDTIMPRMTGTTLIGELRLNHGDVKIIAMSGGGRTSDTDNLTVALAMGADRVLAKPFNDEQLLDAIRSLMERPVPAEPRTAA
jgi:CheY-like chemotaxis protein